MSERLDEARLSELERLASEECAGTYVFNVHNGEIDYTDPTGLTCAVADAYVTRKVQTDLLEIVDTYSVFSQDYARRVINDVRVFLDEEVIDRVRFVWIRPGTNQVLAAFDYTMIAAGIGLADDSAGDIRYRPELAYANFSVYVFYNNRWQNMSQCEKTSILQRLSLNLGPGGQLDYVGGRWIVDRTYSRDVYGLSRSRFER